MAKTTRKHEAAPSSTRPTHKRKRPRINMNPPFTKYVREWIRQYGTAGRLADAVDMSLSAFSRGVRNEGTLSVYSLLRLAEETGEPASKVLRIANKGHVADIIERLYGDSAPEGVSGALREHLDDWTALTDEQRAPLEHIIKQLASGRRRK